MKFLMTGEWWTYLRNNFIAYATNGDQMIIHQIKQTKEFHLNECDYVQLQSSPLILN